MASWVVTRFCACGKCRYKEPHITCDLVPDDYEEVMQGNKKSPSYYFYSMIGAIKLWARSYT